MNQKIALVIRKDLEIWQKLNVSAFLASAVAIDSPQTHGAPFVTGSGSNYLPFLSQPILIYGADDVSNLKRALLRSKDRGLKIAVYPKPLFATKSEAENLEIMRAYRDEDMDLVGIAVYGESKAVSKALDGLKFHP